jgi:hypothetical protein
MQHKPKRMLSTKTHLLLEIPPGSYIAAPNSKTRAQRSTETKKAMAVIKVAEAKSLRAMMAKKAKAKKAKTKKAK